MTRILFAAAIAAAGLLGATFWVGHSAGPAHAQTAETVTVEDMTLGNPDAAVTMVEYASFTCPHCAAFHENTFAQLKADYIDTGKIHFVYREVYFDRFGLWAGMLARCGGEALYGSQPEWAKGGDPAEIAGNLRKLGRTAGLSDEEVTACMSDQATAEAMVASFEKNAEADGISSTPSFVINGETYTNMPYDEMKAILDAALAD